MISEQCDIADISNVAVQATFVSCRLSAQDSIQPQVPLATLAHGSRYCSGMITVADMMYA